MKKLPARTFRRGFVLRLLLPAMLLGAQGCGTSMHFIGTTRLEEPVTLSRLYVYSFLDLRTAELGRNMMNEIGRQLGLALENRGVATEQHWFRNDPLSAVFARSGSTQIPVRQVIEQNAARERQFGSPYRLVAFPRRTSVVNGVYRYDFTWTLEDAQSRRVLWSTTSHGEHTNITAIDDDPVVRAQMLVDGLIAQMDQSGLFGAAPASIAP